MELQSIKNRFSIIGNDHQLNYALQVAAQVANTDLSVLIFGESGVGKEVFSQIIHSLSPRRHNPFIAVNCGAIPEGTIDSELFGHEKGSFTSAGDQRKGYFETVNGGTIFLDEIGEMPLGTQARLLRVLETGEFIRVGSSKVLKTNVRVVAATNKDLLLLTKANKFREDLYYRLNTVPIRVPALRERQDDIPLLFRKFASDFSERYRSETVHLTRDAEELIKTYPWPGNVRELKNIAEQISVLSKSKTIDAESLSHYLPSTNNNRLPALSQHNMNVPSASYSSTSGHQYNESTEREILYKLFFDLKKDMNELKGMLFELAKGNNFSEGNLAPNIPDDYSPFHHPSIPFANSPEYNKEEGLKESRPHLPYIIQPKDEINEHIEVDESLSLLDKEKEIIIKALQKHKGKRKNAAKELGISERTLYRKIKEYEINE